MAKGDYDAAEALAGKGREVRQFLADVEELRKRWRVVRAARGTVAKGQSTPLWEYCQPILRALVEAGGEATRSEIEPRVERLMAASLRPGDRSKRAGGRERWQFTIQRARKALVTEGWIEGDSGKVWRITSAGRRVAEGAVDGVRRTGPGSASR
jgi:hypothetical protein